MFIKLITLIFLLVGVIQPTFCKTLTLRETLLKEKIKKTHPEQSRGKVFADSFTKAVEKVKTLKNFVFVVPSRNNELWCERNLVSMMTQQYPSFRIIYINDASTDNTESMVLDLVKKYNFEKRFKLISNKKQMKMAYNRYIAGHMCQDDEIIVGVDGDDWLVHDQVLSMLNLAYQDPNVWLTYGQMIYYPSGELGFCKQVPFPIIEKQLIRKTMPDLPFPHLRTFYAWLFKLLPESDFIINGQWMEAATDRPLMYGLIELAGIRAKAIQNVMYVYNRSIDQNTHKIHMGMLIENKNVILKRKPYKALTARPATHEEYKTVKKQLSQHKDSDNE